mgnify:CR=1 FL=1|jgi:hypothetical protein
MFGPMGLRRRYLACVGHARGCFGHALQFFFGIGGHKKNRSARSAEPHHFQAWAPLQPHETPKASLCVRTQPVAAPTAFRCSRCHL